MANWIQKLKDARQRPKKLIAIGVIAVFVGFYLWGLKADAAEVGLGLGFGYASNDGATYQEIQIKDDNQNWYGSLARIGGDTRNNYHYWRACGGYQVNWRRGRVIEPYARLGACYFDEEPTDYISDELAYELAFGVRLWDIVEVDIDTHNSTAGRSDQNEGLDGAMLRVIWRF